MLLKHKATYTGGCVAFWSPSAWRERGEARGLNSELIVVYDGSDLRRFFNMDACSDARPGSRNRYALYEEMQAALEKVGLYFEECTGCHSAVYSDGTSQEAAGAQPGERAGTCGTVDQMRCAQDIPARVFEAARFTAFFDPRLAIEDIADRCATFYGYTDPKAREVFIAAVEHHLTFHR